MEYVDASGWDRIEEGERISISTIVAALGLTGAWGDGSCGAVEDEFFVYGDPPSACPNCSGSLLVFPEFDREINLVEFYQTCCGLVWADGEVKLDWPLDLWR